jgi:lysophospholipase L1-like esterase
VTTRTTAILDPSLAIGYAGGAGLWAAVCGAPVSWALLAVGGTLAATAMPGRRRRGLVAVATLGGVAVGLARRDADPLAIGVAVLGIGALIGVAWTPRSRRIAAVNLVVFAVMLAVAEAGLRVAGAAEGSRDFQPIQILRDVTDGAPDAKTGRDATFTDGLRTTTDQPASSARRVLLFGGSTTECIEVGDAQTWPSALQRLLGGAASGWRVENHGRSATTAANRATALESVADLGPGDLVVFYVGVNDAGASFALRDQPVPLLVAVPRLGTGLRRLSTHSVIADRLFRVLVFGGISTSVEARQAAIDDFRDALARASAFTAARGARFVPVLQSHLFTRAEPTDYDEALAAVYSTRLPEVVDAIYPALWEVVRSYPGAIDARTAQDGLARSPYYDWHHVDARGNEAIARFVHERIDWNG